jgi:hypothetical protein
LALVCNNLGNSKGINVLHKIIENFKWFANSNV